MKITICTLSLFKTQDVYIVLFLTENWYNIQLKNNKFGQDEMLWKNDIYSGVLAKFTTIFVDFSVCP